MPEIQELKEAPQQGRQLASTIGRNTMFGLAATLAFMTTRLITVPIVIKYLGLDGYGIWSIIMVTAAYMRVGSAGVKCAFQKYVAEATGNGDFERANRLLSTGTALMLGFSVLGVTPVFLFSAQIAHAAGVPNNFLHPASASISLLALIIFVANTGAAFEAIITGAQRFDLVRKVNIISALSEAGCIVLLLHLGKGLLAMSSVMAVSEFFYIGYCMVVSRRVLPQIRIRARYVTRTVVKEFILFAGSYQLVNIQEVIYSTIMPVAVLKYFGATVTGAYAVAARLVQACMMPQDSFLLPVLSGSSLVFASGSVKQMEMLVAKAFKTTFAMSVLPLSVICASGNTIIYAWTGRKDDTFESFLLLMSLASLFSAQSLLQLVLYRASGKALMDNVRQAIRIVLLLTIGALGGHLGLRGILTGLALTEFTGMVFMFFALRHAFPWFKVRVLLGDALKILFVGAVTAVLSIAITNIPIPWLHAGRSLAVIQTFAVGGFTLAAAIPLLFYTKAVSASEFRVIRSLLPG